MVNKKAKKETKYPKLIGRSPIAVKVFGGARNGNHSVCMVYRVTYLEKNSAAGGRLEYHDRIEYGALVRTLPGMADLNGTEKQKTRSRRTLRPELYAQLKALKILLDDLETICMNIDEQVGRKVVLPEKMSQGELEMFETAGEDDTGVLAWDRSPRKNGKPA